MGQDKTRDRKSQKTDIDIRNSSHKALFVKRLILRQKQKDLNHQLE